MMSIGFVPVSAEINRTRTSPPMPPPMGNAIPIPRRSSMFPLPARPCHLMSCLQASGRRPKAPVKNEASRIVLSACRRTMHPECRLEWLSYDAKAMDLQLNDKVAIVTGSSRGIGLAIAHALAAEGCRITLCARTDARLRQAASEVEQTAGRAGRDRKSTRLNSSHGYISYAVFC